MLKSLLRTARQWSREIFAILSTKPRSQVTILMYRTWAIIIFLEAREFMFNLPANSTFIAMVRILVNTRKMLADGTEVSRHFPSTFTTSSAVLANLRKKNCKTFSLLNTRFILRITWGQQITLNKPTCLSKGNETWIEVYEMTHFMWNESEMRPLNIAVTFAHVLAG